jgi:sec-independent protein translocase protein TatC
MKAVFARMARIVAWPFRLLAAPFIWLLRRGQAIWRFFAEDVADEPLGETLLNLAEGRDSFQTVLGSLGEHLDALRRHLFRALIALLITTALSLMFADKLMVILAVPLGQDSGAQMYSIFQRPLTEAWQTYQQLGQAGLSRMIVIEPTESIGIFMRVSLLAGLAFAMPWIVLELYVFIGAGLLRRERALLAAAIPAATLLFLAGVLFTYFVMLPTAIPFLFSFMNFRAAWRPNAYFGLVTNLMFWIGVSFQMPLIIYTLAAIGLIKAKHLVEQWRIAVVAIAIIAAVVTPTVDPVNMGLVMLPLILLYGFSIAGAAVAEAGRQRRTKPAA